MNNKNSLGFVKSIFICLEAGLPMLSITKVEALKDRGLLGDRYADHKGFWQNVSKPKPIIRNVSIINESDIINSGFTESETRRNIVVTSSIDLNSIIGKKFFIGNVEFFATEECAPCKRPSELSGKENFATIFKNKGGIRAQVLNNGELKIGDSLILQP
jgi:MOSC domain-containing protein YiiM